MDFIGAVGCGDGCAAFQLEKGNKTRISLFYGYGHARETVRSGFVVGSSGAWPGYEGQGKMHLCLAYHPYAKLSPGMVAEKDKARHVAKSCAGGKICDVFSRKPFHECLVGAYELGEKGGRLLPLTLPGDVAVVSSAERKNREQMSIVIEISAQPAPGGVISRS